MKSQIEKLKEIGINFAESTIDTLKNSKPVEAASTMIDRTKGITEYFKSEEYEEDLDQIIDTLYMLSPSDKPDFQPDSDLKTRIQLKAKFVRKQVFMFVVATGSAGLEIGSYFFSPKVGLVIGTAVGILVVSFVGGQILVRRLTPEEASTQLRTV